MASSGKAIWELSPELPDPTDSLGVARTWQGYRDALAKIAELPNGITILSQIAADLAARIEAQNRLFMEEALRSWQASTSQIDAPVVRSSTMMADQSSPVARGARPSPSRQPSPLDLLLSSTRVGPRLAAKIVIASAKSQK